MALRVVLVGLVACLGFEWPTGAEWTRLVDSGRAWASSQWQGWKDPLAGSEILEADASAAPAEDTAAPTPLVTNGPLGAAVTVGPAVALGSILSDEGIFRGQATAPCFAAPHPTASDAAMIEVVDESPEDTSTSALAATEPTDLGFEAVVGAMASTFSADAEESAPEAEEPASLDNPSPDLANASNHAQDGIESEPAATGDRLNTAVRLTGQAVQAWMSVLNLRTPVGNDRP